MSEKKRHVEEHARKSTRIWVVIVTIIPLAILIFVAFLFGAFTSNEPAKLPIIDSTITDPVDDDDEQEPPEVKEERIEMYKQLYFMPDNTLATFHGVGNEYAPYTKVTHYLDEEYVRVYKDNGGVLLETVYQVTTDGIREVYSATHDSMEDEVYTLDQIKTIPAERIVFTLPAAIGGTFSDYTLVDQHASIVLEDVVNVQSKLENVIVFERKDGDFVETIYFAKGYGEVKNVFDVIENGEVAMTVTSHLVEIEPYGE